MKCEENCDAYEENLDVSAEEITKEEYKKILDNDKPSAITVKWAARTQPVRAEFPLYHTLRHFVNRKIA